MRVFRIQKTKYAKDISGVGSTLVSGRWHLAGRNPILYTSSNTSLAILEYLVHLPSVVKPPELVLLTIELPDAMVTNVKAHDLPEGWDRKGYSETVQLWGTNWLAGQSSLAIEVPSVASPDRNILINPGHHDFHKVKVVHSKAITLDDRLI